MYTHNGDKASLKGDSHCHPLSRLLDILQIFQPPFPHFFLYCELMKHKIHVTAVVLRHVDEIRESHAY